MSVLPIPAGPVTLRALRPGDCAAFQAYRSDPEVARYQGWSPLEDEAARGFLDAMEEAAPFPLGAWWQIGVAQSVDDRLVGDMGLCLSTDGRELELGITLAQGAQGNGWALRAVHAATAAVFAHTPASRIVVITHHENAAALALIRRLGLRQVDTLHECGFPEPVFEIPRP